MQVFWKLVKHNKSFRKHKFQTCFGSNCEDLPSLLVLHYCKLNIFWRYSEIWRSHLGLWELLIDIFSLFSHILQMINGNNISADCCIMVINISCNHKIYIWIDITNNIDHVVLMFNIFRYNHCITVCNISPRFVFLVWQLMSMKTHKLSVF